MIEGASGFGTPVALGAPMLVSTGHPAFESVVVLLVFNTFATVWGAVGKLPADCNVPRLRSLELCSFEVTGHIPTALNLILFGSSLQVLPFGLVLETWA